jgi:hypothetical protein
MFGLLFKIIYLIFIVFYIFTNKFNNVGILVGALISSCFIDILCKKLKLCFSPLVNILLNILILSSMLLGEIFKFYGIIPIYDDILHAYSGVLFSIVGYYVLKRINTARSYSYMSISFICLFMFCFSVSFHIFWEIFEFISDSILKTDMQNFSLKDTMIDILDGVIASFLTCIFSYFYFLKAK